MRDALIRSGFDEPLAWAGSFDGDGADLRVQIEEVFLRMGFFRDDIGDGEREFRLNELQQLAEAARAPARAWARNMAQIPDVQLGVDEAHRRRQGREEEIERDLKRLRSPAVLDLPTTWRGKRYTRAETAGDPKARQNAEDQERARWGRKVVALLLESGLPLGQELRARGLGADAPEASRCLRGLRWTTLKKRVSDWEPARRFFLAETGRAFPEDEGPLLRLFEVRKRQGAAKTSYDSTLASLRFLEEAGEQIPERLLWKSPALNNAAKEAAAAKAKEAAAEESQDAKGGQAPQLSLAVLEALETAVGDTDLPLFRRGYAWYRLLRHWACLRFDDTAGLAPDSLERRARGVYGLLKRTKTSGPDKKTAVLPVFVSEDAYLRKPWLYQGLELWKQGALYYRRDYFLPLPTEDLQGTCGKRARYSDASYFSRALLGTLPGDDGERLLHPASRLFWTEHSDRVGLDSWLGALGVGADLRRFVGRWGVQASEDVYVRTALRVTENLQRLAAAHARKQISGGPDFLGEEHLLHQLGAFLRKQGVSDEDASSQIETLRRGNWALAPDPVATISESGALSLEALQPSASDQSGPQAPGQPHLDLVAHEPAEAGDADEEDGDKNEDEKRELQQALVSEERLPPPQGFVIAISRRGAFKRLHFAGGCWRVPGVHYHHFQECGPVMPELAHIDARCKDCFPGNMPKGAPTTQDVSEQSASEEEGSTSSSSSSAADTGGD